MHYVLQPVQESYHHSTDIHMIYLCLYTELFPSCCWPRETIVKHESEMCSKLCAWESMD
jgi:hypothetical protein